MNESGCLHKPIGTEAIVVQELLGDVGSEAHGGSSLAGGSTVAGGGVSPKKIAHESFLWGLHESESFSDVLEVHIVL